MRALLFALTLAGVSGCGSGHFRPPAPRPVLRGRVNVFHNPLGLNGGLQRVSGDEFVPELQNRTLDVDGATYHVWLYLGPEQLEITEDPESSAAPLPYTAELP